MEIISEYYTELLSEFYLLNSFIELKADSPAAVPKNSGELL